MRQRQSIRTRLRTLCVIGLVAFLPCCAPKAIGGRSTANLTTAGGGVQALHGVEAVKYLDIVRDLAIDGEKIGTVKTATAALVVKWHRAAITTIDATPGGWKASVLAGIDQLSTAIPPNEQALFAPYILSAKTIIQAVIQ